MWEHRKMNESNREKFENNLLLWLTILGVPAGISIGLFAWIGLDLKIWLPVSVLISLEAGLIALLIFQRGDIKDLKEENARFKREISNAKKKKKQTP